jgi:hypothetical protein
MVPSPSERMVNNKSSNISGLEDHTNENSNVVAVDDHDGTTPNVIVVPTP